MEYIEIDKNKIPYEFELSIENETYQFEVMYNTLGDFFTINLYKNFEPIRYGEKLVYNGVLFEGLEYLPIPKMRFRPYDTTNTADRITFENLNEDVFIYVD